MPVTCVNGWEGSYGILVWPNKHTRGLCRHLTDFHAVSKDKKDKSLVIWDHMQYPQYWTRNFATAHRLPRSSLWDEGWQAKSVVRCKIMRRYSNHHIFSWARPLFLRTASVVAASLRQKIFASLLRANPIEFDNHRLTALWLVCCKSWRSWLVIRIRGPNALRIPSCVSVLMYVFSERKSTKLFTCKKLP